LADRSRQATWSYVAAASLAAAAAAVLALTVIHVVAQQIASSQQLSSAVFVPPPVSSSQVVEAQPNTYNILVVQPGTMGVNVVRVVVRGVSGLYDGNGMVSSLQAYVELIAPQHVSQVTAVISADVELVNGTVVSAQVVTVLSRGVNTVTIPLSDPLSPYDIVSIRVSARLPP
jgi:hypothetical protein